MCAAASETNNKNSKKKSNLMDPTALIIAGGTVLGTFLSGLAYLLRNVRHVTCCCCECQQKAESGGEGSHPDTKIKAGLETINENQGLHELKGQTKNITFSQRVLNKLTPRRKKTRRPEGDVEIGGDIDKDFSLERTDTVPMPVPPSPPLPPVKMYDVVERKKSVEVLDIDRDDVLPETA